MKKNKLDVGFVILHYQTTDDTLECVQSIKNNIDTHNYLIVVVDNHSPNNSGDILCNRFSKDKNVLVIKNSKNSGFSRGNNVGYRYLKNNYDVNYIAMLNNDTKLCDKKLFYHLNEAYNNYRFDVLGPKIILLDGSYNSNPARFNLISKKEIEKTISSYKTRYFLNKINLWMVYSFLHKTKDKLFSKNDDVNRDIVYKNVQLHGSALFFSKSYIQNRDGLTELTYMYFEEDVLFNDILKNNMTSLYYPNICILHKEGSSTKSVKKTSKQKDLFEIENGLESSKKLLKYLNL